MREGRNTLQLSPATTPILQQPETIAKDRYIQRIRDLLYQVAGLYYKDQKLPELYQGCAQRMSELGLSTTKDYYTCLTISRDRDRELGAILRLLTIERRRFFQSHEQMKALTEHIIPALIESKEQDVIHQLRLWSAGCGTGEEAYSLAIAAQEAIDKSEKSFHFEVLATDNNEAALAKASEAIYTEDELLTMPGDYRAKYFQAHGMRYQVREEIRKHVNLHYLNLQDDSKMVFLKGIDVIVCSYQLLYLDAPSKRRVLQHFYQNLSAQGYLFVGETESLFGVEDQFRLIHIPGGTAYFKGPRTAA